MKIRRNSGFTLVELVIVVGILAVLLAIVLIAINPSRQFAQANNAKRSSDIDAIINAIGAYEAENAGLPPSVITTTSTDMKSAAGGINVCSVLVPNFIAAMPADPKVGTYTSCASYDTGYFVSKDASNRVTVTAPSTDISVSTTSAILTVTR